ncbi:MAG: transglutaminase domain-containing protein [Bilifractor sp.]|jgi:hypothetical protein
MRHCYFKNRVFRVLPAVFLCLAMAAGSGFSGARKSGDDGKPGRAALPDGWTGVVSAEAAETDLASETVNAFSFGDTTGIAQETADAIASGEAGEDLQAAAGASSGSIRTNIMYRLYNPNSGEHFFTSSTDEKNHLMGLGWQYEGVAWYAPKSGSPVYRMYNPVAGEHHYTLNKSEVNMLTRSGWRYEGVGWYSLSAKNSSAVPLYRLYNQNQAANNHHFTVSVSERNHLISLGWRYESVGWYGVRKSYSESTMYYYDRLSAAQKKIYTRLLSTKETGSRTVDFSEGVNIQDLKRAVTACSYDNPDYYWIADGYTIYYSRSTGAARYASFREKPDSSAEKAIRSAVSAALKTVPSGADEYQTAKKLYTYLINTTDYLESSLYGQDVRSVLQYHSSVCAGYARTFKLLCNEAGIECSVVTGTVNGIGHAWNLLRINGVYTWADPTWEDTKGTAGSGQDDDFFCVADDTLNIDPSKSIPEGYTGSYDLGYTERVINYYLGPNVSQAFAYPARHAVAA